MKKLLFTLVYIIFSITLFAKPTPIDSLKKRMEALEVNSIKYSKANDSLIAANSNLLKQADYNEKLLNKYDILNNYLFATMGVLFAAFGLIGYFLIFKPARDDLKEVQTFLHDIRNDMGKLFSEYIIKNRDTLIDNALSNIENDNLPEITNSVAYIDAHKHEGFNDKQILRMIKLLKKNNKDGHIFMEALWFTENDFAEEFLIEYLRKRPMDNLTEYTILYFAKYNKLKYLNDIAQYVLDGERLIGAIANMKTESVSFTVQLLNNDILVNGHPEKQLITHMVYLDMYSQDVVQQLDLHNTKLYQKYLSIRLTPPTP
jgi:hypothetical protein